MAPERSGAGGLRRPFRRPFVGAVVALVAAAALAEACAAVGSRTTEVPPAAKTAHRRGVGGASAGSSGNGASKTASSPGTNATHSPPGRLDRRVDSVLALMTLEEKAGQLCITGARPDLRERIRSGRLGGTNGVLPGQDVFHVTREMQRLALRSRLHIPLLFMGDVIHGFRTVYPVPLALAATWDTALVTSADSASAVEATAAGVDWTFAPMLDIARDPRWGRVVESPGEDPFLGAAMARAAVHGYQGDVTGRDLAAPTTMAATAKHFAGYGAVEGGRDYNTVDLSQRRLRSVYLPTFHAAVDAGVAAVMAAFTALDGVPATADAPLLRGILRDEWGFHGLVVSDYDAVPELQNHRVAADTADAVLLAMKAGVDMDLHSLTYADQLPALVRSGRLDGAAVDDAVRRVLKLKFELGLFDDPFRYGDSTRAERATLSRGQRTLARRAAEESLVLLENRGDLLPLAPRVRTVAVLGPLADDSIDPLGPVHAVGRPTDTRTVLEGIRARAGRRVRVLHTAGAGIEDTSRAGFAEAVRLARRADVAVVVVGEAGMMSGEGGSRSRLGLPGVQLDLVQAVAATGTPVVVVLMSGRPLVVPWLAKHVPALLEAWFPGTEAGDAIAAVLFGDAEPGGRLPVSFPRDVGQIPVYYAHRNTGRPAVAGDRYTSKYLDVPDAPLYPFGYGLSYTRFSYSAVRLDRTRMTAADTLTASVTVTNTGSRVGSDVIQLYLTDEVASVSPAVEELRGFRRVRLRPGESREVTFRVTRKDLAFYSADMARRVTEPGFFTVSVGPSSAAETQHHARFELISSPSSG